MKSWSRVLVKGVVEGIASENRKVGGDV